MAGRESGENHGDHRGPAIEGHADIRRQQPPGGDLDDQTAGGGDEKGRSKADTGAGPLGIVLIAHGARSRKESPSRNQRATYPKMSAVIASYQPRASAAVWARTSSLSSGWLTKPSILAIFSSVAS